MKVGILALQGDVREHALVLAELGTHVVEVRSPEDLAGIDALVLPGGESTTLSMLVESSGLIGPIAERLSENMPALGTCAGLILLSAGIIDGRGDEHCFGAVDIHVRRNAFGRQLESFECELRVNGVPGGPMPAVFIRAPVVQAVAPTVEVLATLPGRGADQGDLVVACRQGAVLVTAFHPELSGDLRIHELFLSTIEERGG